MKDYDIEKEAISTNRKNIFLKRVVAVFCLVIILILLLFLFVGVFTSNSNLIFAMFFSIVFVSIVMYVIMMFLKLINK